MARTSLASRSFLVMPLVLLTVAFLEEVGWAELRPHLHPTSTRVVVRLVLEGAAFGLAANRLEPWIRRMLVSARSRSRKQIGALGPWVFFVVAYGALFAGYYVLEKKGW